LTEVGFAVAGEEKGMVSAGMGSSILGLKGNGRFAEHS
jgi:hypothetical protein